MAALEREFPPGTKKPEDSPRSAAPVIEIDAKSRRGIVFGAVGGNCRRWSGCRSNEPFAGQGKITKIPVKSIDSVI